MTTTSGTGSQVTQVAVMTETATQTKSAVFNNLIYPRVAIVDPDLMVTVPRIPPLLLVLTPSATVLKAILM